MLQRTDTIAPPSSLHRHARCPLQPEGGYWKSRLRLEILQADVQQSAMSLSGSFDLQPGGLLLFVVRYFETEGCLT